MEQKIYIDFFPIPSEPNPFMFNSKEDYFKARDALFKLYSAEDEWEERVINKNTQSESDIICWRELYKDYHIALKQGIQDRFKEEIKNWL